MGKKAPWHLWAIGILSLLWNLAGAVTIVAAQHAAWPGLSPDETAYYAAQPVWFVILTDLALLTAVLGALGLLMRRKWAVAAFATSLVLVLVDNGYDVVAGSSRVYANSAAMIVTVLIAILAALQLVYANAMAKRGVLA
jgi:cell division protein FtsW (lipid II flippase)